MSNETKVEVEDVASYIKYINELSPTIDGDARTYESTFVFRGYAASSFNEISLVLKAAWYRGNGVRSRFTPIAVSSD